MVINPKVALAGAGALVTIGSGVAIAEIARKARNSAKDTVANISFEYPFWFKNPLSEFDKWCANWKYVPKETPKIGGIYYDPSERATIFMPSPAQETEFLCECRRVFPWLPDPVIRGKEAGLPLFFKSTTNVYLLDLDRLTEFEQILLFSLSFMGLKISTTGKWKFSTILAPSGKDKIELCAPFGNCNGYFVGDADFYIPAECRLPSLKIDPLSHSKEELLLLSDVNINVNVTTISEKNDLDMKNPAMAVGISALGLLVLFLTSAELAKKISENPALPFSIRRVAELVSNCPALPMNSTRAYLVVEFPTMYKIISRSTVHKLIERERSYELPDGIENLKFKVSDVIMAKQNDLIYYVTSLHMKPDDHLVLHCTVMRKDGSKCEEVCCTSLRSVDSVRQLLS